MSFLSHLSYSLNNLPIRLLFKVSSTHKPSSTEANNAKRRSCVRSARFTAAKSLGTLIGDSFRSPSQGNPPVSTTRSKYRNRRGLLVHIRMGSTCNGLLPCKKFKYEPLSSFVVLSKLRFTLRYQVISGLIRGTPTKENLATTRLEEGETTRPLNTSSRDSISLHNT